MNKVFGIGWAKTGTTTLGQCFRILGFNHQGQRLDLVWEIKNNNLSKILDVAKEKDTFEDWPWIALYEELDNAFPDSRFVLTRRKPENWLRSYKNMLATQGGASQELNEIRTILYQLPFPNVTETQLIDRYEKHNSEVERYFRRRPNDLLIVDWEQGSGWRELCAFLGIGVPNEPFPHSNKGKYGTQGVFKRIIQSAARYTRSSSG